MKKATTINLGGFVFYIDEDAYQMLQEYLKSIELEIGDISERSEIMSDIEARLVELFRERSGPENRPITIEHIREIIGIMGRPDDFSEGSSFNDEHTDFGYRSRYYKRYRRMYRDVDHRVLGGVCSGISEYYGIDPTIVRILFIVFAFSGFSIILYLVLWVGLPEARSTAQKLEMKGERVTVSNIINFFKDEFNNVKNNFKKNDRSF